VSQGELRGGTEGRITFSLESALNNWSYTPANPISAHISASRISLADLDRLANRDDPLAGMLALELHLKGTQRNPTGRGNLVLENATVAQEKVQRVEAQFEGNGEVVNLGLHARMAAGKAEGSLIYYPKTQGYQGRLEASNLRIEKFSLIAARNAQVAGAMDVKVEGQGTLERPEIVASVSVPELRVQKQTIQGTNLQARVREGVVELSFNARVAQTNVKASGTVGVAAPYQTDLHLDTGSVPLHDLLALYAPGRADGFTGQTELHAYVRGPLTDRSRLDIHLEAPVLTASYKEFHLAAVKAIHLDYRDGVAVLHPSSIQGTGTDIQMEATIPVKNPSAAKFLVRGTVDLRAAQLLQPGMQSSGRIEFDVDSRR
jgi:translocation and assembly module TamB